MTRRVSDDMRGWMDMEHFYSLQHLHDYKCMETEIKILKCIANSDLQNLAMTDVCVNGTYLFIAYYKWVQWVKTQ